MNTTKPATPLPWGTPPGIEGTTELRTFVMSGCDQVATCNSGHHSAKDCQINAAYIVHACNAYPRLEAEHAKLKEALRKCTETVGTDYAKVSQENARALLRELGEG